MLWMVSGPVEECISVCVFKKHFCGQCFGQVAGYTEEDAGVQKGLKGMFECYFRVMRVECVHESREVVGGVVP